MVCRASMVMPCAPMVRWISRMIVARAASMPSTRTASMMWLVVLRPPTTPSVPSAAARSRPSTASLNLRAPQRRRRGHTLQDGRPARPQRCGARAASPHAPGARRRGRVGASAGHARAAAALRAPAGRVGAERRHDGALDGRHAGDDRVRQRAQQQLQRVVAALLGRQAVLVERHAHLQRRLGHPGPTLTQARPGRPRPSMTCRPPLLLCRALGGTAEPSRPASHTACPC